jgi:putative colanic acid biosynthesis acetyltransferase WcaF
MGARAWIAAGAFVGSGVTVGAGSVIGARCVLFKDSDPRRVYAGNPRVFCDRHLRD